MSVIITLLFFCYPVLIIYFHRMCEIIKFYGVHAGKTISTDTNGQGSVGKYQMMNTPLTSSRLCAMTMCLLDT